MRPASDNSTKYFVNKTILLLLWLNFTTMYLYDWQMHPAYIPKSNALFKISRGITLTNTQLHKTFQSLKIISYFERKVTSDFVTK